LRLILSSLLTQEGFISGTTQFFGGIHTAMRELSITVVQTGCNFGAQLQKKYLHPAEKMAISGFGAIGAAVSSQ